MKPTLTLNRITKRYGDAFFANRNVNFNFMAGQIHALVGENGAGKTTLMKILFGLESANSGEILINSQPVVINSPIDAKTHRIAMVHQHFMLENQLTVRDHLQLEINSSSKTWGFMRNTIQDEKVSQLLSKLKLNVGLGTPIGSLSVVEKQKIEILKTLLFDPEILIFDEPTAVLPPDEVEQFYDLISELKQSGKSIALITHKLADVIRHCDYVTVLRLGEVRFHAAVAKTDANEIARHMIGDDTSASSDKTKAAADLSATSFKLQDSERTAPLKIYKFSCSDLKSIDLHVQHGEIVSFAGVESNGQNALIEYLIRPENIVGPIKGSISILGLPTVENLATRASSSDVRALNIGFIGPDRLSDSAILDFKINDHYRLLPHYRKDFVLKPISKTTISSAQQELDIRPNDLDLKIGQYSGGNQQKWVVGRETSHYPELLLACHPTRGVDFSATEKIHNILRGIRHRNRSVVLLSSDLDEVLALSDRIYVFFSGQIVGEFLPPFNRSEIGRAFGGAKPSSQKSGGR